MDLTFEVRPDGIIDAAVGPALELFSHALVDAISSRAPKRAVHPGLSTYWIDRTDAAARQALKSGEESPFASGNATYLRLDGERVLACYDFDPQEIEAESMPVDDFFRTLDEWRQRVIDAGGVHGAEASALEPRTARPMPPVP